MHPAKVQVDAKQNSIDRHSALVEQYTAQRFLTRIAKRIDDIEYENYNIPTLLYQHRVTKDVEQRSGGVGDNVYIYKEEDYVDARETYAYDASAFTFKEITNNAQAKQLEQINRLLDLILNKHSVRLQKLRKVVGETKYIDFIEYLSADLHQNEILYSNGMPTELKYYSTLVHKADFLNSRFEKIHGNTMYGKSKYTKASISKASSQAESAYEDALERLGEIYGVATGHERYELDLWMDRDIDFEKGIDRTIGIEPESIPRVRGSKSTNARDSGLPKLSVRLKREMCALYVLLETMCDIAFNIPQPPTQNATTVSATVKLKLKQLLRNLNPEKD